MNQEHQQNRDGQKPRDYTDKDVHLKPLVMFFVVTALAVTVVFVILRVIQTDLANSDFERTKALPDFATERQLPPEDMPLLQTHPTQELAAHRAYEKSLIDNGVAWADPGKTKARIPVTNAMQILISQNAFPARGGK